MFYKSGFTNYDNAVYAMPAPGYLADACGFIYQEFSSIDTMKLKPNSLGASDNTVNTWFEFLQLKTAEPLAYIDHPFFGQWPCITENAYGKGHLIYLATVPSDELLAKVIARAAARKGISSAVSFPLITRSGVNGHGRNVHYLFNYSATPRTVKYPFASGTSLLDSQKLVKGAPVTVEPWGVVIGID